MNEVEAILFQALQRGFTLSHWKWPPLKTYNGFTHEQRVKGWQAVKLAVQLGLIPHPSSLECSICGGTYKMGYHSEDYSVVAPHAVCLRCHRLIHQRYKMPVEWGAHVARYQREGAWFSALG